MDYKVVGDLQSAIGSQGSFQSDHKAAWLPSSGADVRQAIDSPLFSSVFIWYFCYVFLSHELQRESATYLGQQSF